MDCSRQSLLRKNEKPSVLILNDLRKTSKMAECCWQKKQLKVWLMNGYLFRVSMKMDEEDHKPRQALRKNNKKSEKALSQADFPKNPVISFSVLRAMLCNQKRYCTGKPRYHNGFGVFSCPNFQVQTKRYYSLLRGLELPTPTISGGF